MALGELSNPSVKVDVRKTYAEYPSVNRYIIGKTLLSSLSGKKRLIEEAKAFLSRLRG